MKADVCKFNNHNHAQQKTHGNIHLFLIRTEWMSAEVHDNEVNGCTVTRHDHDVHDS